MIWNGTEISVWNMENARMEGNGRFQEWNGRQSSFFQTKFRKWHLQKNRYGYTYNIRIPSKKFMLGPYVVHPWFMYGPYIGNQGCPKHLC